MEEIYENDDMRLVLKANYKDISDPQAQFLEFHLHIHRTALVGPTQLQSKKDSHFSIRVPMPFLFLLEEESKRVISGLILQVDPMDRPSAESVKRLIYSFHQKVLDQLAEVSTGALVITADLWVNLVINEGPLRVTTRRIRFKGGEGEEESCAICLEDFVAGMFIYMTPCKHLFHHSCYAKWMFEKQTCPICRFKL